MSAKLVESVSDGVRRIDVIDAGFEPDLLLGWATRDQRDIAWRVMVFTTQRPGG